jgi:hypothetical protein
MRIGGSVAILLLILDTPPSPSLKKGGEGTPFFFL